MTIFSSNMCTDSWSQSNRSKSQWLNRNGTTKLRNLLNITCGIRAMLEEPLITNCGNDWNLGSLRWKSVARDFYSRFTLRRGLKPRGSQSKKTVWAKIINKTSWRNFRQRKHRRTLWFRVFRPPNLKRCWGLPRGTWHTKWSVVWLIMVAVYWPK